MIVNCPNHLTSKMCILVHLIVNPVVQAINYILKDSQQLLQTFDNLNSTNKNYFFLTEDFSSFSTWLRPYHVIDVVFSFLFTETKALSEFKITLFGFRKILSLIFFCNIFKYNSSFY